MSEARSGQNDLELCRQHLTAYRPADFRPGDFWMGHAVPELPEMPRAFMRPAKAKTIGGGASSRSITPSASTSFPAAWKTRAL